MLKWSSTMMANSFNKIKITSQDALAKLIIPRELPLVRE